MKPGRLAEKKAQRLTGARLQPGSGSIESPTLKADLRSRGELRIEMKETSKPSFTFKAKALDKLCRQSRWDELPIFGVLFLGRGMIKLTPDSTVSVVYTAKQQITLDYSTILTIIGGGIRFEGAEEQPVWKVEYFDGNK